MFNVMKENDRGVRNVMNSFASYLDDNDFFELNENLLVNAMYELTRYIRSVDSNACDSYPNQDVDVAYYLNEYLWAYRHEETIIHEMLDKAIAWKDDYDEKTAEILASVEYAEEKYGDAEYLAKESGCANAQFTAEKCFENGNTHGFKSITDMVACAKACVDDDCTLKFNCYDSGSYGIHHVDGTEECGFEVYGTFLGNSEEQDDACVPPIDFETIGRLYPSFNNLWYSYQYDSYVSVQNNCYFSYNVPWDVLEEKGTEMGLRD